MWENDKVQFARLLCEIMATCEIAPNDWDALCGSMDLERAEVDELLERANDVWEGAKRALL